MGLRIPDPVRNAMADAFETYAGTGCILRLYTGAKPANVSDARSGTVLADITFTGDWLNNAATGAKTLLGGPFADSSANAGGVAGYGTLFKSDGTTIVCDAEVTDNAGAGPIKLVSTTITAGQPVEITAFTVTMPTGT